MIFNYLIIFVLTSKMYISGNGEVYDDEEIYNTASNIDDVDDGDEECGLFELEDVISRWERAMNR